MATKIYSSRIAPWEDGGQSIEQWESGLIRLTQSYLVPTTDKLTYIQSFAKGTQVDDTGTPASDGLYVYPEPTCTDLNNGFSRITVTAYGRKDTYSFDTTYSRISFTYETPIAGVVVEVTREFLVPTYRVMWVTRQGELPSPAFLTDLKYRDPVYVIDPDDQSLSVWPVNNRSIDYNTSPGTGYGEMQEQVYNVDIAPTSP